MTATVRIGNALAGFTCAASVALGAYASHAAQAQARQRIGLAALFAFAHALSLIMLSTRSSRLALAGRSMLAAGIVLFSGSLAMAGFFETSTVAAPFGGTLFILGWLVMTVDLAKVP